MHTFSPAKMWIAGLKSLSKPLAHLHTQFNRDIPWSTIDMDFMNLHQSAHGGREFGYLCTRLRKNRTVVVGHWEDPTISPQSVHEMVIDWLAAGLNPNEATIFVHDPSFYGSVALGGSIGAAEAYMRGEWSASDLATVIRIFAVDPEIGDGLDRGRDDHDGDDHHAARRPADDPQRAAAHRATMAHPLVRAQIREVLAGAERLPSPPQVALEILELVERETVLPEAPDGGREVEPHPHDVVPGAGDDANGAAYPGFQQGLGLGAREE